MLENVYETPHPGGGCSEIIRAACGRQQPSGCGFLDCRPSDRLFGRSPLEEWLDELGALIGQLHLHDNWGHKDDHLPMARAAIDFVRLFALLKAERSRPPVVTLEIHQPHDVMGKPGVPRTPLAMAGIARIGSYLTGGTFRNRGRESTAAGDRLQIPLGECPASERAGSPISKRCRSSNHW